MRATACGCDTRRPARVGRPGSLSRSSDMRSFQEDATGASERRTAACPVRATSPDRRRGIEVAFDIEEAIDCELNLTPDDFGLATGESRTVAWLVDSVEEQIRTARG